jgi:hypothetical protein
MSKKKQHYIPEGNKGDLVVTEAGGVLYHYLTREEAVKLAEYINRTGKWAYKDVWEHMGWEKP